MTPLRRRHATEQILRRAIGTGVGSGAGRRTRGGEGVCGDVGVVRDAIPTQGTLPVALKLGEGAGFECGFGGGFAGGVRPRRLSLTLAGVVFAGEVSAQGGYTSKGVRGGRLGERDEGSGLDLGLAPDGGCAIFGEVLGSVVADDDDGELAIARGCGEADGLELGGQSHPGVGIALDGLVGDEGEGDRGATLAVLREPSGLDERAGGEVVGRRGGRRFGRRGCAVRGQRREGLTAASAAAAAAGLGGALRLRAPMTQTRPPDPRTRGTPAEDERPNEAPRGPRGASPLARGAPRDRGGVRRSASTNSSVSDEEEVGDDIAPSVDVVVSTPRRAPSALRGARARCELKRVVAAELASSSLDDDCVIGL